MIHEKLSDRRLNQHKQQLIGQITMSQENKLNVMLAMAKSVFYFNHILTLEEISENINSISPLHFQRVAGEMLDAAKMSSLIYEPVI